MFYTDTDEFIHIFRYIEYLPNKLLRQMKNRQITHAYNEAKIYKDYYRPSFNPLRLLRSVLAVLITGNGATAQQHVPGKKKGL